MAPEQRQLDSKEEKLFLAVHSSFNCFLTFYSFNFYSFWHFDSIIFLHFGMGFYNYLMPNLTPSYGEVASYGTQTPGKHPYCFMNIWWATCAPQFTVLRTSTVLRFLISIGFLCSKSGMFLDTQLRDIC
jgi:hypothetical protein